MKRTVRLILAASAVLLAAFQASAEPVKVSIWSAITGVGQEGKTEVSYSDTPIGNMVSAITGVDWQLNYTQNSDFANAFNLRLASDDWTEAINMPSANLMPMDKLQKLIDAKVIVPLDKYYNNPKYPYINMIPKAVIDYWRMPDGHIYNFPSGVYADPKQAYGYWAAAVWAVRPDYLAAVGMTTADLKTIAGVEKFLRAVKSKGLKNSGGLPVYPISSGENIGLADLIINTFGVSTAGQGFDKVGTKMTHIRDNPQTKAALQWLNSLWIDGIIDPEALSQKDDTLREKMMGKRVAMMASFAWPYWQTVTAGITPVTDMAFLEYPTAPGAAKSGVNVTYNPNGGGGGILITKNAKNPEAIVNLVNETWKDFDPKWNADAKWEHQLTLEYGNRGVFWDWDPKLGKPYYVTLRDMAAAAGDYNKIAAIGFSMNPIIVQGNDSNYFTANLKDVLDWIFRMHKFYYNKPNVAPARAYDSLKMPAEGVWNKNAEVLGRLDLEYKAKLISAPKGGFEAVWKDYQNQLEQQGSWSKVRAEWEAAYKAQVK